MENDDEEGLRVCHLRTRVRSLACGWGLRRAVFFNSKRFYATCKWNSSLMCTIITLKVMGEIA